MKQKLIPVISIIMGVLAFLLTNQFIQKKRAEYDRLIKNFYEKTELVDVLAASKDLPKGTKLQRGDMTTTQVPKRSMPDLCITDRDVKQAFARKTLRELRQGEMILWSDLEGGDPSSQGLAPTVQEKLRAISLNISGAAGVSGMVRPNDRVDVLGTFSFPSKTVTGEMETVTLTVLQDVTILATGQQLAKDSAASRGERNSTGYNSVTVEVTPREAELLVFAQQMRGSLSLSLRNPGDQSYESELPSVNFGRLESSLPELNRFRQQNIRHKKATQ
jgi:pilus assembly protein CpaB